MNDQQIDDLRRRVQQNPASITAAQPTEPQQHDPHIARQQRIIAALEQWLDAIHVARAERRA